ncbi:MAG: hypothetical protein K2L70_00680, partial [Clostridia bacterium]|nr:hypothetical protein [Clostridia bacterium]
REQHPDWDDESIYKETNLIYAEKSGGAMQVVDPTKPPEESVVMKQDDSSDKLKESEGEGLQDVEDPNEEEEVDE